jgi:hypothetical protein
MKAYFGRKVGSLAELRELTEKTKGKATEYEVVKEVDLDGAEFRRFANSFLNDQPWIDPGDGGHSAKGVARCIRVTNLRTGERVLVNSEGYGYPRYTAIEG